MIPAKNIKKAEINVRQYLSEGLLEKTKTNELIIETYLSRAQESLELAESIYANNESDLWVLVISYYSMFYIANAVLLKYGYKVGDKIAHKITSDSLIVFVKDKLKNKLIEDYEQAKNETFDLINVDESEVLANETIESFEFERNKRSMFQYNLGENLTHSKAKTSLKRAEEFFSQFLFLFESE
ncbi:MAG: HEPN domain-containing protein [Methanobrevibacter sp.]|nr:HEPN domain-containing protein [Candidatus Methanovirga australis]